MFHYHLSLYVLDLNHEVICWPLICWLVELQVCSTADLELVFLSVWLPFDSCLLLVVILFCFSSVSSLVAFLNLSSVSVDSGERLSPLSHTHLSSSELPFIHYTNVSLCCVSAGWLWWTEAPSRRWTLLSSSSAFRATSTKCVLRLDWSEIRDVRIKCWHNFFHC